MLTKEQINSIRHVVTCDDLHLTECASEELRRLALLGLEHEERTKRVVCSCSRCLGDYCPTIDPDCVVHGTKTERPWR